MRRTDPTFTDQKILASIPKPMGSPSGKCDCFPRTRKSGFLTLFLPAHVSLFDSEGFILLPMRVHDRPGSWLDSVADQEPVNTIDLVDAMKGQFLAKMILNGVWEFHQDNFRTILVQRTNNSNLD